MGRREAPNARIQTPVKLQWGKPPSGCEAVTRRITPGGILLTILNKWIKLHGRMQAMIGHKRAPAARSRQMASAGCRNSLMALSRVKAKLNQNEPTIKPNPG
jgi:hypothetical protein